jgi:hypothetical protein
MSIGWRDAVLASNASEPAKKCAVAITKRFLAMNPAYASFQNVALAYAASMDVPTAQACVTELKRRGFLEQLPYHGQATAPFYRLEQAA